MQYIETEKSGVCSCCGKEFLILAKFDEHSPVDGFKPLMSVDLAEAVSNKFAARLQEWQDDKRCLFCDPRYKGFSQEEVKRIITKEGICTLCGEEITSSHGRVGVTRQCRVIRIRDRVANIWYLFPDDKTAIWYNTPRCSAHMRSPKLRLRKGQTEAGARYMQKIRAENKLMKIRLSNDPMQGGGDND